MSGNWSIVMISDDEDQPLEKQKKLTRTTKRKIPSVVTLISDDESDDGSDDESDEYDSDYQPPKKEPNQKAKERKMAENDCEMKPNISKFNKSKEMKIKKEPNQKAKKRKMTENDCEQGPSESSNDITIKQEPNQKAKERKMAENDCEMKPNISKFNKSGKEMKIKKEPNQKAKKRKITENDCGQAPSETSNDITIKQGTSQKRPKIKNEYEKPGVSRDFHEPEIKKIRNKEECHGFESPGSDTCWQEHELLAYNMNLNKNIAKNVINLLAEGNTIPFIARYRREATGNMTPEVLREVKNQFEEICQLKQKIKTVVSTLQKTGNFTKHLEENIRASRSLEELEIIYAPYKPEAKRTLAERAKALGLEQPAINLLLNNAAVNLYDFVNKSCEELSDITSVQKGVVHIIAQKIAMDSDVLAFLRNLRKRVTFTVETKKMKSKATSKTNTKKLGTKPVDESKFENYFDYKISVKYIKPHQILAINRGEQLKVLSVKIVTPDYLYNQFRQFCYEKWVSRGPYQERRSILEEAFKDSYTRLVQPFVVREIRSELKNQAEKASIDVFSKNLKHLLLTAPVKGQVILGIDPGYSHGCKLAVICPMGTVLDTNVIYPHSTNNKNQYAIIIKNLLEKHDCSLISLGDGSASQQTEEWLTELINTNFFYPRNVKYAIVSEDGASIYSCSPEAKKEFGDMDTNLISAVSLARRIQDPMAELVKVEPKHLGVGMYQHDLKKKSLDNALDEVVSECVSFVGVDLNTTSQALLRRIAGLTDKRANEIIKYREKNGAFIFRKQLVEVSGIGPKVFQQCAGFLRVGPTNSTSVEDFYKNPKTTRLDQTYIHPESYDTAQKLLNIMKVKIADIGKDSFINRIKAFEISHEELKTTKETLDLIKDALAKPLDYDLRTEVSQTVYFSTGLKSIDDLSAGSKVMGRVKNVVHFGCFVDIGVGREALIHSSKMGSISLHVGDRVEVVILAIDKQRQRIQIEPVVKFLKL